MYFSFLLIGWKGCPWFFSQLQWIGIHPFPSRGQQLCKFFGGIRTFLHENNSLRIFSVHKHGRRVKVCFAQNGRRDVTCERSFLLLTSVVTFCNSVKVTLLTDIFALWSIGHWDCQADESLHQSNCETTESKLLQSSLIRSIRLVHVVRIKTKMLSCDTL